MEREKEREREKKRGWLGLPHSSSRSIETGIDSSTPVRSTRQKNQGVDLNAVSLQSILLKKISIISIDIIEIYTVNDQKDVCLLIYWWICFSISIKCEGRADATPSIRRRLRFFSSIGAIKNSRLPLPPPVALPMEWNLVCFEMETGPSWVARKWNWFRIDLDDGRLAGIPFLRLPIERRKGREGGREEKSNQWFNSK